MSVQHSTLTGSELHVPFNSGVDASKAASPALGAWYFATDTGMLYYCASAGTWSIFSGKKSGTFDDGDLSTGVLTITHSLGLSAPYTINIEVFDNNGDKIIPDDITGATNSVAIDLTSYGTLSGTWGYAYLAG